MRTSITRRSVLASGAAVGASALLGTSAAVAAVNAARACWSSARMPCVTTYSTASAPTSALRDVSSSVSASSQNPASSSGDPVFPGDAACSPLPPPPRPHPRPFATSSSSRSS